MTSMEDLIDSLTGGMHVSQEGYDIRALQEYLRATLPLPNGPRYPTANHPFKPAPSRAPSATRKPHGLSVPHDGAMGGVGGGQPMPSPMLFSLPESMYGGGGDGSGMPLSTPAEEMYEQARPANLRRASSYGFAAGTSGMPVTPPQQPLHDAYAFEHDAFAPLIQQQAPLADPWARFRQASEQAAGGNAVAGPSSGSAFGEHFAHRTPPSGEQRLEAPTTYNGEYNDIDDDDDMMEADEAEAWLGEADEPRHDSGLRLGFGGGASEHDRRASFSPQQLDMQNTGWVHMPAIEVAQRPVSEPGFSWDRGRRQF